MAAGSNSTGELGVLQEHNEGRNKAAGWQQSSEEESDGADEADGEVATVLATGHMMPPCLEPHGQADKAQSQ